MDTVAPTPGAAPPSCQARALHLLQRLGYTWLPPHALATERDSPREVILVDRLVAALKRLNPGLSEPHVHRALRELTGTPAAELRTTNQRTHTLLTGGLVIDQNGGTRRLRTVRYLDLQDPANNELVVTTNLPVRGLTRQVVIELVVFVNGIPLVLIRCAPADVSAPADPSWVRAALTDLWRWQEPEKVDHQRGVPRLFETAHLLLALGGQTAVYGSVLTPPSRFATWRTPWPRTTEQVAALIGSAPTAQDLLLCGLLAPPNLFELLQNFVAFCPDSPSGHIVRTLSRSSEFLAVQQAAARAVDTSGGVIWHALGGGGHQQLLLAWLVRKLLHDPLQQGRAIILVAEDSALPEVGLLAPQLVRDTVTMQQFLNRPGPQVLQVNAQLLRTFLDENSFVSSSAARPIVLLTEVLSSPIQELATLLRQTFPNACIMGFTNTPLPRHDNTIRTALGPYLSTYDFASAIADQAAVPVYYEARPIPAAERVLTLCRELRAHFLRVIKPSGGTAQLLVRSGDAVRLYRQTLDRLGDRIPEIFVGWELHAIADPAARLQVVYLDTPVRGQTLLQTVLRLNAPTPDKLFALIIDYSGTSLPDVLQEFVSTDIKDALRLPQDEFLQLPVWHQAALTALFGVKNLYSLEQCLAALENPVTRRDFQAAFDQGAQALELLLDAPSAQGFVAELRWLGQVLLAAAARYRDDRLSLNQCGARVRQLIAQAVINDGHQLLVARVPLLTKSLDDKLAALPTGAAKVSELFYALQHELQTRFDDDPALFAGMRDQLAHIRMQQQTPPGSPELVLAQLMGQRASLSARLGNTIPVGLSPTAAVVYEVLTGVAALAAAESQLHYGVPVDPSSGALAEQLDSLISLFRPETTGSSFPDHPEALQKTLTDHLFAAGWDTERARITAERIVQRFFPHKT